MLMPERVITSQMEIARGAYLPAPPMLRTGLFMREGLDLGSIQPLVRALEEVLRPREAREPPAAPGSSTSQRKRARQSA
jgi:hypothetical protein